MNNIGYYRIISLKPRRKHAVAVGTDPATDPQELKCERDDKGFLLLDLSLFEDGIISENLSLEFEELSRIVAESYYRKAKSRALWYLSSADHSEKGLLRKLMRYFPEDSCRRAVDKMSELGYIDDKKFAQNTRDILVSRGLSDSAIISKLVSAGVSPALAKSCVVEAETDQISQIELLIEKKYKNRLGDEDSIRRTFNALARRGFSFGDIKAAIKKYTQKEFDEEC